MTDPAKTIEGSKFQQNLQKFLDIKRRQELAKQGGDKATIEGQVTPEEEKWARNFKHKMYTKYGAKKSGGKVKKYMGGGKVYTNQNKRYAHGGKVSGRKAKYNG